MYNMPISILSGVSIQRTLSIMNKLVHNFYKDVKFDGSLRDFFNLVKNLPFDGEELAVGEILKRPIITLSTGGDCDDKAILISAFLLKKFPKLKQGFKIVDFGDGWSHVYNYYIQDNIKLFVDSTYQENIIFHELPYLKCFAYEVN